MNNKDNAPVISHAEPVFAVSSVSETVSYWHEVIGFPNKWTWGELPNHGGVSWNGAFVQFFHDPELAERSKGNCTWIRVRNVEALYEQHQQKDIKIVSPLSLRDYGMTQYTIREINGYYINFAGVPISEREKSEALSSTVEIIARTPTAKELNDIMTALGWHATANEEKPMQAVVFAVTAEDTATGKVIGCAFLLGDNAGFYYVKNVFVHPDWQGKQIGTKMMQAITDWINKHAPKDAFIALHTPENLEPFYRQFDFSPSFSMIRII